MTDAMANIRAAVMKVYDFKPAWVARVNAMPDNQVMAVYRRFAEDCFDPESIKKDGKYSRTTIKQQLKREALEMQKVPEPQHTYYLCTECRGWFIADNPELVECRFCGSHHIMRGTYNEDF